MRDTGELAGLRAGPLRATKAVAAPYFPTLSPFGQSRMNAVESSFLESAFVESSRTESVVDPVAMLERELRRDIPLARMMDIRIESWDGVSVTLVAPLGPNINDKGCAFGGSLASLMTIAGWALIRMAMDQRSVRGDVYVQDSQIRYLAPVFGELRATARLVEDDSFDNYFSTLSARGKARLGVCVEIASAQDIIGSSLTGRYVAFAKSAAKPAG